MKIKQLSLIVAATLLLCIAGACNDEVFVDSPADTPKVTITLDSTQPTAQVEYTNSGLRSIALYSDENVMFTVRNPEGYVIFQSTSTSVRWERELQCEISAYLLKLTVSANFVSPDIIKIKSTKNLLGRAVSYRLILKYEKGQREIDIDVAAEESSAEGLYNVSETPASPQILNHN